MCLNIISEINGYQLQNNLMNRYDVLVFSIKTFDYKIKNKAYINLYPSFASWNKKIILLAHQ